MSKSFKLIFLSSILFASQINIADCALLKQLKPFVVENKTDQKNNSDFILNPNIILTAQDYREIAYNVCADHGTNASEMSEIEKATIFDARLIQLIEKLFERSFHSYFTLPAAIKQGTKSHSARKKATQAMQNNVNIITAISSSSQNKIIKNLLKKIRPLEEEVLGHFMFKSNEYLEFEKQRAAKIYPFSDFTKYETTVELYNRFWQTISASIFATLNFTASFINFATNDIRNNKEKEMHKLGKSIYKETADWKNKNGYSIYTKKYNKTTGNFKSIISEPKKHPFQKKTCSKMDIGDATDGYDHSDYDYKCTNNNDFCYSDCKHNHELTLPAKKLTQIQLIKGTLSSILRTWTPTAIKQTPRLCIDLPKNSLKVFQQETAVNFYNIYKNKGLSANKSAVQNELASIGHVLSLVTTCSLMYVGYRTYKINKELLDQVQELQKELIHINHYLQVLEKISIAISKDPELAKAFKNELKMTQELFGNSKNLPKELKSLMSKLMSSSFSGDSSYFFSRIGKIVTTMDEFEKYKHLLVPYFEIFGKIDLHFAIASLYQKNIHSRVSICLPEICDQETPCVIGKKIWHPMIDQKVVVANDILMGVEDYEQNWIITGANAGGKTTTITALINNIYFSQNFGIACAESFAFTPFSKIISALDITTNLGNNQSLFKAEADRAKLIKDHAVKSTAESLVFTAIDEPFNGTEASVASQIAYEYLKQLGDCSYHMAIVTTHFPNLTKLEQTSNFTNMKVGDATVHEDKHITYPFTIERGISTQNIAKDILIEQNVL